MGWASGSRLAGAVWEIVAPFVEGDDAQQVAEAICEAFKQEDCDTLDEAQDLYNTAYPWSIADDEYIQGQFATEAEAREDLKGYPAGSGMRVERIARSAG